MTEHKYCPHCEQKMTYELNVDKGSVETLETISRFIKQKGINCIHVSKEIGNRLSNYQIGNLSILRFHGLIEKVKGHPGNYCLTTKGLDFGNGKVSIIKTAIIQKGKKSEPPHLLGYVGDVVNIKDSSSSQEPYWNMKVKEGQILTSTSQFIKGNKQAKLL